MAQATIGYDENGKQIRKTVSGKTRAEAIITAYLPKTARAATDQQDMSLKSICNFG
ncbi:MAG: hypothetical protein ACLRSW_12385 [Christensenellaceae bacterium]